MTTTESGKYVYDERYEISALAVESETVAVITLSGDCYGLDAATGDEKWRLSNGGSLMQPTLHDGRLYVGGRGVAGKDEEGTAYAVDSESGEEIWAKTVPGEPVLTPVVVDETVYFGAQYHGLHALSADDGEIRWSETIGSDGVWLGSPVIEDGIAYFGGREKVRAYDVENRSSLWSAPHVAKFGAFVNGLFCFGTEGSVKGLHATSGEVAWENEVSGWGHGPAVADYTLLFNVQTGTLAVDTAGDRLWHQPMKEGDEISTAPATDGNAVYVPSMGGTLQALGVDDGKERWSYTVPEGHPMRSSPVKSGDRVYVGDHAGNVHAINAETGERVWIRSITPEQ